MQRGNSLLCFYALDILHEIETSLLKVQHEFLSPSISNASSFINLQQKARLLASLSGVPPHHVKEIEVWLKHFIGKHPQFKSRFKYNGNFKNKIGYLNANRDGNFDNVLRKISNGAKSINVVSY